MGDVDRGRLARFVGVLLVAAVAVTGVSRLTSLTALALAPAYMFSPLVAGLFVCFTCDVSLSAVGLRLGRPRWLAVAAVGALSLVAATLSVSLAVPGIVFDLGADPVPGIALPGGVAGVLATLGLALALGATVNGVFAFGEEFGWRAYLLPKLWPLGRRRAILLTGVIWGVWHWPVIAMGYNYGLDYPRAPVPGLVTMVIATVGLGGFHAYVTVRSGSVWPAALTHGTLNAVGSTTVLFAGMEMNLLGPGPVGLVAALPWLAFTAAYLYRLG